MAVYLLGISGQFWDSIRLAPENQFMTWGFLSSNTYASISLKRKNGSISIVQPTQLRHTSFKMFHLMGKESTE